MTQMEEECMEALAVFWLYNEAIKELPFLHPLHKTGPQTLGAGAVQEAAKVFDKYLDRYPIPQRPRRYENLS